MVEQSHKNYIRTFTICKGIISRTDVKETFKIYTINRERYFLKELETAKEFVNYSNHYTAQEKDLADKLRMCISNYLMHRKFALDRPTLSERFFLQRSLHSLWKMIRAHWLTISKDDPHANRNPNEFTDDIEEVLDHKGKSKYVPVEGFWRAKPTGPKAKRDMGVNACYMQKPTGIRHAPMTSTNDFPIIWDSGASICITHDKADFVEFSSATDLEEIQGFANSQQQRIEGSGTIAWYVNDTKGRSRELKIPAYYIPTSRVRLLSVGTVLKHYPGEEIVIKPEGLTLSGIEGSKNRRKIFAPFNCHSRLPVSINHTDVQT